MLEYRSLCRCFVEALNETINGKVKLIAPVCSTLGDDVIHKTTLELDTPFPDGLRAGMNVEVQFETN